MANVLTFPALRRIIHNGHDAQAGPATIIILPVIRVERYDDEPSGDFDEGSSASPGRKRRRRASRT